MSTTRPTGHRTGTTPLDPDDPEHVRDVAEAIYRQRLDDSGKKGEAARMVAADKDGGAKLRNRAQSYDLFARIVMTKFVVRRRG